MSPSEMDTPIPDYKKSLKSLVRGGVASVVVFLGSVGVWAGVTNLSGAVVAPGQFVVAGSVKKVQHPTGGIVGELRVRDGDYVEQDAVLVRLDDTVTRANLEMILKQLDELTARRARLEAERDRRALVVLSEEISRGREDAIALLLKSESNLFDARRSAREGKRAQLVKRISQLQDEIKGLQSQQASRDRQEHLIEAELGSIRNLFAKNLVPLTRKNALERDAANLDGQEGQLLASVAQAQGKIAETQLQLNQIDEDLQEEVAKELREIQAKFAELIERKVAADDQLKRVEIRAPSSGYVHQLAVHTVGGVITPAEPAMLIVPEKEMLQLDVRIAPHDIDQISLGQPVKVRVLAFNQRTTPELDGVVSRISADSSLDQQKGMTYFTVRVAIAEGQERLLGRGHRLAAGMQAEVFVKTEDRTPFQFIVKPLGDQISRAFRER